MLNNDTAKSWTPLSADSRVGSLDVMRGISLFGVLLINAWVNFRVSLFEHLFTFHSNMEWHNRATDILLAGLIEFKAFTLFALLFGVGVGVQSDRTKSRSISVQPFLARRFLALMAIGLFHMFLIWNGDILLLYSVCGLMLIPIVHCSARTLAAVALLAFVIHYFVPLGGLAQSGEELKSHAVAATNIYSSGTFWEIMKFRWQEAWHLILPLIISVLFRTFGIMIIGLISWRVGVVSHPGSHRTLLVAIAVCTGTLGSVLTAQIVLAHSATARVDHSQVVVDFGSTLSLALAYGSIMLLCLQPSTDGVIARLLAAVGRMALTNYVMQSVLLGFIFYGYGLGQFGRLGSATVAFICCVIFLSQALVSDIWLRHFRFGPLEWLWRTFSYGRSPLIERMRSSGPA